MKKKNFLLPLLSRRKTRACCQYLNSKLNLNGVLEETFPRRLFINCFAAMGGRSLHISRGQLKREIEPKKINRDRKLHEGLRFLRQLYHRIGAILARSLFRIMARKTPAKLANDHTRL